MNTTTTTQSHGRRIARRLGAVLAGAGLAVGVAAAPANAAVGQWNGLSGYGTGSGSAIIDSWRSGTWSTTAYGRVQITARSYCVKVQYAPYAYAAVDGGWNNTSYNCSAYTTKVFSWSDTMRLSYNGMKFRICTTAGCGAVTYIRNY
jgi:hypothetical protein